MDELENKQEGLTETDPTPEKENPAEEAPAEEVPAVEVSEETPGGENPAEEAPAEEAPAEEAPAEEDLKIYEPQEKKPEEPSAVPVLTEEKNPELAPVSPERSVITPAVQYSRSMERERKIAEEVKKRQRRPMILILAMCVVLIIFAIVANAVMKDFSEPPVLPESPAPTQPAQPLPTADVGQESQTPASPAPEQAPTSRYELIRADASWTQAQEYCLQRGGHLAVVSNQAELDAIIALAEAQAMDKLWLGCHRENGALVWENGESVDFYPWAEGEPSQVDSYDGAAEDYLMLWNENGWHYNDSRNDPVADYPEWYSGSIGFVCEYPN